MVLLLLRLKLFDTTFVDPDPGRLLLGIPKAELLACNLADPFERGLPCELSPKELVRVQNGLVTLLESIDLRCELGDGDNVTNIEHDSGSEAEENEDHVERGDLPILAAGPDGA